MLPYKGVLNFPFIFMFTTFPVYIWVVQFYAFLWQLENVSIMEYKAISVFSITNKTSTNKHVDLLLQKIFLDCLDEKSSYRFSILKVFLHYQQMCATKRRKTEVLLISFPFHNNRHPFYYFIHIGNS